MGNASFNTLRTKRSQNEGQAILEYVLGLTIAILVSGILMAGLRRPLQQLWSRWNDEVRASCPKCDPPLGP